MFKKTAIILAALAMSVGSATATIVDACGTTYSIAQLGRYSLQCGDKTFGNFDVNGPSGDLADATVTPFMIDGVIGLNFGGSFLASTSTGPQDYHIFYSVKTNGEWLIESIGQAFTPSYGGSGGDILIGETVRLASFFGPAVAESNLSYSNPGTCATTEDCEDPIAEGDQLILLDPITKNPKPQEMVWVTKDINLNPFACEEQSTAVCNNRIAATLITQWFVQVPNGDIPDVPEPTTMLLFSTALLGLGFMRRKKS